jgi:hypothetical protein
VIAACSISALAAVYGSAAGAPPPPVLDIPGLAAREIRVAGVSRLDDGGALVAGTLSDGPRARARRLAVTRLQPDGTVDLSYGNQGISLLTLAPGSRATSMAIDPRTGQSWVGVAIGATGEGGIVAFDPEGRRRTRFGHAGTLRLHAEGAGGPAALAWRAGALLVGAGRSPCRGCNVSIRDPLSGTPLAARRLTPVELAGTTRCVGSAVTSAVFAPRHEALIATKSAGHIGCGARVLILGAPPRRTRGSLKAITTGTFRTPTTTSAVAASAATVCLAGASRSATELGPFIPGRRFAVTSRGPSGGLVTVVPLGRGACAELVASIPGTGGFVVQAAPGETRPPLISVPRGVQPLGMFRCHQDLLVIGSRQAGSERAGVIIVIPLRRGFRE